MDIEDMSRFKRKDVALGENGGGGQREIETLIKCLAITKDENLLHSLVWSLGENGSERAVEPLIDLLSDKRELLRRDIAMSLEQIGGQRAIEVLLELLADESQWVRRAAAEAMGCLKVRRAVEALLALLSDESEYVRSAAAEALGKVCRRTDKDAIEVLSLVLGRTSEDENVRAEAESAILRIRRRN